ncbi:MAG: hypothetical protein UY12_C0027G0009 [Parcubacteria group bacterium GW2011_GWA2_47_8b]|nr:MAG: hypothetical protein UY12_C0027G0009 [Parcubacteria group bacterium GW2011_GWA2_47_8b]
MNVFKRQVLKQLGIALGVVALAIVIAQITKRANWFSAPAPPNLWRPLEAILTKPNRYSIS